VLPSQPLDDVGRPRAIVAISQYLTRLPSRARPRTIMILLTTGHFAGGNGARAFRKRHKDDLVKRTNAALTIEHLGLREWDELPDGRMGPTGRYEPGAILAPGSKALVDAAYAALRKAKASPAGALNHSRVRAESIAFTEMILRLGRTPGRTLERYTL
jgi:hypothetical protein